MTSTTGTTTRRSAGLTGQLVPVAVVALATAAWLVLLWPRRGLQAATITTRVTPGPGRSPAGR